ncbi:ribose ABC transporter ATP-binding protein [Melghiribacillus thermohalophilus]|uniref:Ribose ABC transporter ATP-binding protein n=1 Tax=Melghiribacillus thermohalophilus TaxID=1324956 RepID=A0A4R3NCM3_9BACI|nr:sugar ABC transporter ATP-binding protein [Melghiribacillus thermohalophilus]TCT26515.1 ribose ABC transporter ATP-binding protein [Melghiribacillus thermohalophilus]
MTVQPLVEMKGISKSFNGNQVLKKVNLDVYPGEVLALVGENGAGKSTLMKILTGIYSRDEGEIFVKGKEVSFKDANESKQSGVAIIHQELNIIPHLSVMENMFLGRELTFGKSGVLQTKGMRQKTLEYLEQLGVSIDPDEQAGNLSVGQQQMIEIAKAISTNAEIIIMDEPTAALTERETRMLFDIIHHLKNRGVGIVYISHRMEEIFEICSRITVLRDGEYIGTRRVDETDVDEIIRMMVGRKLGNMFPERRQTRGNERLKVENLSGDQFDHIHFEVYEGEILGIAGLMGAGRSEIVEALFGARPKHSGNVYIDGKEVKIKSPYDAIQAGIGFVTEDRKQEGLVLGMSVRENFTLTNLRDISSHAIVSSKKEKSFVQSMIDKFKVKTSSMEQEVKSLSGGNQQKIVIGKWLGINPKILILDEPTRGVDVGAKKEIYQIMNQLTEQGVAIIMISSELPEVLGMSDRILVIHEGKVASVFNRKEANQEKIMHAATGGM